MELKPGKPGTEKDAVYGHNQTFEHGEREPGSVLV